MTIRRIDAIPVKEPGTGFVYTAIKLETSEGLTGWGEAPTLTPRQLERARAACEGQDPTAYDVLTQRIGTENPACGGVNMALLDVSGKIAKAPVCQLLGGPTRNKVRALTWLPPEGQLDAALAEGHRAFTVPVRPAAGIVSRPRFVASVVKRFEDLRKTLGEQRDFVADAAASFLSAEAADLAVALEPLHPLWFDRPVRAENTDVLSRISSESAIPVGLGHEFDTLAPLQNLLREGLVDVVRLSLSQMGITPIRRAAAVAETYYVAVAPYVSTGGPIATAAAIQLAASLPNFFIQQVPLVSGAAQRQREELVGGPIERVKDGYLSLPTKPGLGVEVSEPALRRMAA
jgi:galactonate dehydratase